MIFFRLLTCKQMYAWGRLIEDEFQQDQEWDKAEDGQDEGEEEEFAFEDWWFGSNLYLSLHSDYLILILWSILA